MLDDCIIGESQSVVYRLAAIFTKPLDAILLKRGINIDSIQEARAEIARVGDQYTAEEIISNSFRGKVNRLKPFPESRFSDGTIGVFYSAHEFSTCKQEIAFHLKVEEGDPSRYYALIECEFSGLTADLRGKEENYSDLVSQTKNGYSFCQQLRKKAKQRGLDAFYTKSARKAGGTCVPVFTETSLMRPGISGKVKVTATSNGVQFDETVVLSVNP